MKRRDELEAVDLESLEQVEGAFFFGIPFMFHMMAASTMMMVPPEAYAGYYGPPAFYGPPAPRISLASIWGRQGPYGNSRPNGYTPGPLAGFHNPGGAGPRRV